MISFPNAKINIGLQITEKREDGFHNIESVLYPVDFCDVLEVQESKYNETKVHQQGNVINDIDVQELSVVKAYNLIKKDFSLPCLDIFLYKNIPTGGGLGGGSSDATTMLKILNTLFDLKLTTTELLNYASNLGSDDSFFVKNTPQLATGRGNLLQPIPISLEGYYIVLINPQIHISTPLAYKNVIPQTPNFKLSKISDIPIIKWKQYIQNDFEKTLFPMFPLLEDIKNSLYKNGAIYASLSGSGATSYGIFQNKPELPNELQKYVCFEGKIEN